MAAAAAVYVTWKEGYGTTYVQSYSVAAARLRLKY